MVSSEHMQLQIDFLPDFLGYSSSHLLMFLCARSFLVIPDEQNYFLGVRRIVGQSSAYACSQVSCSLSHWPDNVIQQLPGCHQPVPRLRQLESWQSHRDFKSTALLPFLKQPYSSSRAVGTGLSSNLKILATSMLRC